jgi:hypothetical protein
VGRNPYLGGTLEFGVKQEILKTEFVESIQERGWNVTWL